MSAGLAQSAIQAAVYARLTGDATLAALVGTRIYDAVPDNLTGTFIAFGDWTEDSDDTLDDGDAGIGSDCALTFEVYSDDGGAGAGAKTVQAIGSRIKELLHRQALTVDGWTIVTVEHTDTVTTRDVSQAGRPMRRLLSTYAILAEAVSS